MIMANPGIFCNGQFLRKSKKLIDAYVTTCELVDKRSKTPERTGAPPVGRLGLSEVKGRASGLGEWRKEPAPFLGAAQIM